MPLWTEFTDCDSGGVNGVKGAGKKKKVKGNSGSGGQIKEVKPEVQPRSPRIQFLFDLAAKIGLTVEEEKPAEEKPTDTSPSTD